MLYFAYGSNMNFEQMKQRCPSSVYIKRAKLEGYRFVYDGYSMKRNGAVANIIESQGNIVLGGLFEINNDNLNALDKCEGYPNSYDRKELEVTDEEGHNYQAITYFRTGKPEGKPSEDYRACVLKGAADCSLPQDYIETNI